MPSKVSLTLVGTRISCMAQLLIFSEIYELGLNHSQEIEQKKLELSNKTEELDKVLNERSVLKQKLDIKENSSKELQQSRARLEEVDAIIEKKNAEIERLNTDLEGKTECIAELTTSKEAAEEKCRQQSATIDSQACKMQNIVEERDTGRLFPETFLATVCWPRLDEMSI